MFMKRLFSLLLLGALVSSALTVFGEEFSAPPPPPEVVVTDPGETISPPPVEESPTPAPPPVQEAPQPLVLIRGTQLPTLSPGKSAQVTITVENVNGKDLISPILTVTPSDSVLLLGGSSSFPLENIPQGQSRSVTFTIQGAGSITSPAQSLGTELRFNYDNNLNMVQATVSDRIPLTAQVSTPPKNTQPTVVITRTPLQPIQAGQEFSLVVSVKNAGDASMDNTVASVTTPEELTLKNDNSTFSLGSIGPGRTATLTLNLKASNQLSSSMASVGLDLKYSYPTGEGTAQGSQSDRINIATVPSAGTSSSVPNIIVGGYDYGKDPVSAGGKFNLAFTLQNTGALAVENLVVTVDGGDSFTVSGGSNTFHYPKIAASGKKSETIQLQALSTAKTGAQSVGISCKYEYQESGKRSPATADIRLSIPVIQPDRFQVNAPVLPDSIHAGEEVTLSLSYVNKGKSEVNNVEAVLEGNVDSPAKTQYLGNFESGKSGNIGFVFTPSSPGQTPITLKINYEDGNQEIHTLTFPLKLEVQAAQEMDFDEMDFAQEKPKPPILLLSLLGVGLLAALVGSFFLIRQKKSGSSAQEPGLEEDDWEEWEDQDSFDQSFSQEKGPEE